MSIQSFKERHVEAGMKVEVYRNLNNGMLSIRDAGTKKVIAHATDVRLTEVTFKVSQKGRDRVLKEKRKNVHAFVCGTLQTTPDRLWLISQVTYNPYLYNSFVSTFDRTPVHAASDVVITKDGKIFVTGTE